jgi:hypothetical protein
MSAVCEFSALRHNSAPPGIGAEHPELPRRCFFLWRILVLWDLRGRSLGLNIRPRRFNLGLLFLRRNRHFDLLKGFAMIIAAPHNCSSTVRHRAQRRAHQPRTGNAKAGRCDVQRGNQSPSAKDRRRVREARRAAEQRLKGNRQSACPNPPYAAIDELTDAVCGLTPPEEGLRETILSSPEELLLDLNRDLMQPSLSPLCPVLLMPGVGFRLSYPIFSGAELSR